METQWLPVSLVVWITALAGTLDARQQVRFVALCTGLLFARGRRTVASWLRTCGAGATTSAITTCSAASDARPWRSPGSCSASSLSGSRAMGRARRWSSPSTTRPPSGTGRTSRAWQASQPHSGTGRVPVPLRPRLGLSGPPGPTLALGSDRPADPLALVHPSQRCRLDGGLLRLAVPHQVGAGRRPDRVAGPAVGARSPADLGGNRRGLRQAAVLEAGAGCGGDGDQSAAVRCGLVVVAGGGRSRPEEGSWPAAEVRQGPDRPGQTHRADPGLADRAFLPLRPAGGEEVQDVPGDLQTGGWGDPCGAGARARSLGGVLLDRPGTERGIDPRDGGRPLGVGAGLPRRQGGSWSGTATMRMCGPTWGRGT